MARQSARGSECWEPLEQASDRERTPEIDDEDGHDDEVDMAMITYLASKLSAVFFAKLPQVVWMLGGRDLQCTDATKL